MANTLTWRDVAAPDFGTALRGISVAGQAAGAGFDTLGKALGDFHGYQQDQAANAVLNNAAGFSDPAALRAAIANGSVFGGIDRSLVTPQALAALNAQPGTLLKQGMEQEDLTHAQQINPLLIQGQQGLNTHQNLTNSLDAALNPLRVQRAGLDNTGQSLDNAGKVISNNFNQAATPSRLTALNLINQEDQQRLDQNNILFGRGTQEYNDKQTADPFLNQLKTKVNGPDDVQNIIASPEFNALSPGAQKNVLAAISGSSPSSLGSGAPASRAIAGAAGGAPGAVPGSANASPFTAIPGYMAKPGDPDVTAMKIADVQNYQTNTVLPRTGATSIGAFQINRDTLTQYAPKALGDDWKNQPLTPENQDKIAQTIFEANKDGNLKNQWTSLPDATPGAYKNKTWDQMRPLIMGGETHDVTGVNQELYNLQNEHSKYASRTAQATNAINLALSQTNANNINSKYATTQQDSSTVGDVVTKMTGKDSTSAYKDLPVSRLVNEINRVRELVPGTTPATAARLLEEHPQGADWFDRVRPTILGGHSTIPDVSAIDKESQSLNTGTTVEADKANQQAQAMAALIGQAQQAHEAATFDLAKALHNPSITPDQLAGYRNKVAISRAILEDRLKSQSADPTLNFTPNQQSAGEQKAAPGSKTVPNPFGNTPALQDTPDNAPTAPVVRISAPASQAISAAAAPTATPTASPFVGGANGSLTQGYQPPPPMTAQQLKEYRKRRQAELSTVLGSLQK